MRSSLLKDKIMFDRAPLQCFSKTKDCRVVKPVSKLNSRTGLGLYMGSSRPKTMCEMTKTPCKKKKKKKRQKFSKNSKKPCLGSILGLHRRIIGQTRSFRENLLQSLISFLDFYHCVKLCKKPLRNRFREKLITDARTCVQTDGQA